jgi:uncharacterized membrane protein YfcA
VTPLEDAAVLAAGFVAGAMNSVVGAGTLLSFPALLALGVPPVTANVSNTLGLVPGSLAGAYGYRRELRPQQSVLRKLLLPAVLGGLGGALLLIVLPARTFAAVVPVLLLLAGALVAAQPALAKAVARRAARQGVVREPGEQVQVGPVVVGLVFLASIYGGYFGAAMSIIFLALFGIVLDSGLQAANGLKNMLTAVVNLSASVVFVIGAPVDWVVVVLLALGSGVGGLVGSRFGRELPDRVLRTAIVVIAVLAAVHQLRK